eukprot:CAMPEP_0116562526 /NCGR_PEP_ID=MMETSP0397-20121206/12205_1 /TAXON_ID=216820 /ORGANISM="Cyclophora tenuis, Strain ECT3854" /LENGTH=33 /DNA_ID= /DNA_START= /DNA_END= /DNA_ORIENTATION=
MTPMVGLLLDATLLAFYRMAKDGQPKVHNNEYQ